MAIADTEDQEPMSLGRGTVETNPPSRPRTDYPTAILWVPDPEQRHGWREFYVYSDAGSKPGGKRLGF